MKQESRLQEVYIVDHAISSLRDYMRSTLDMYKEMDLSTNEIKSEIKAYVDAINVLEIYYYGEKKTSLEAVLY